MTGKGVAKIANAEEFVTLEKWAERMEIRLVAPLPEDLRERVEACEHWGHFAGTMVSVRHENTNYDSLCEELHYGDIS